MPYFHDEVFASTKADPNDKARVVNLEIVALGLQELLEQLNTAYFSKRSARVFASKCRNAILGRLKKFLLQYCAHA